MVQVAKKV